jgi:hypothetical protein
MTDIQGRCPACRGASLFLGEGGHVTCRRIDCPNPAAADQLLHGEQPTQLGKPCCGKDIGHHLACPVGRGEPSPPGPTATQATDDGCPVKHCDPDHCGVHANSCTWRTTKEI